MFRGIVTLETKCEACVYGGVSAPACCMYVLILRILTLAASSSGLIHYFNNVCLVHDHELTYISVILFPLTFLFHFCWLCLWPVGESGVNDFEILVSVVLSFQQLLLHNDASE